MQAYYHLTKTLGDDDILPLSHIRPELTDNVFVEVGGSGVKGGRGRTVKKEVRSALNYTLSSGSAIKPFEGSRLPFLVKQM